VFTNLISLREAMTPCQTWWTISVLRHNVMLRYLNFKPRNPKFLNLVTLLSFIGLLYE